MLNKVNEGLLKGKKGLITGIANNMSISWAIAKLAKAHGAELAFTYQGEVLEKRIKPLASEINCDFVYPCDVSNEKSMDDLFIALSNRWDSLDFIIHAIAFADRNELKGRYLDTSLENFKNSMHISCFSFNSLLKRAETLMINGGSAITLTYHGAQKVMPNYNVMGIAKAALEAGTKYLAYDLGPKNIRVNAISAGPIKTLASSGIGDFKTILDIYKESAPLRQNVTQEDVAGMALFLLSDLSKNITGGIHYVDGGYSIMGLNKTINN